MTKSDIKYIILSDIHLGENNGIFTPVDDNGKLRSPGTSTVAKAFIPAIKALVNCNSKETKVKLILAGDILGLAFATLTECLEIFGDFLCDLLDEGDLFEEIVYIPGNHDHHLWEIAREEEYVRRMKQVNMGSLPKVFHTSGPLPKDALQSDLMDNLMRNIFGDKGLQKPCIKFAYPNYYLGNEDRGVLIHHGHFSESVYQFVTKSRKALHPHLGDPESVEDVESENFAWIDFGWSLLGRSGSAGDDLESIMHTLSDPESVKMQLDEITERIADAVELPSVPFEWMEKIIIRSLVKRLASKTQGERYESGTYCSSATSELLRAYIQGPCFHQLKESLGAVPNDLTFIWGHTHKPFTDQMVLENTGRVMNISNCGGWTVDGRSADQKSGGSLILLNEDLEALELRVFNDVEKSDHSSFEFNPITSSSVDFVERIKGLLSDNSAVRNIWSTLSRAIHEEIAWRRDIALKKLNS